MRRLAWLGGALLLSAALHLGLYLLLPGGGPTMGEPASPAVKVEVWAPVPPVLRPASPGAARPGPPARAERSRSRATPRPLVAAPAAEPEPDVLPASATPEGDPGSEGQAEPAGDGDGHGPRLTTSAAAGTGAPEGGPGAAGLLALSERLAEAARACYPPAARRLRLVGSVELLFCAEADGTASRVSLGGSTGSLVLDRAAEDCLLARATPLPVRAGCFRLPVRFGDPVR